MTNPSIEALDQAIAEIEALIGRLPERPGSVRASSPHATITLDADGWLTDVDFVGERRPGLTALAEDLLDLQDKAIAALTSGQAADGVELGDPVPGGRPPSLIGRDAPQLPAMPSRDDLDRVAAELEARFETARPGVGGTAPSGSAASELVAVQTDAAGLLSQIEFRDQARQAPAEQLAADLVETAAQARAAIA